MKLAILTPSRGRPDRFADMVDAIHDTASCPVAVYCALDKDDLSDYPILSDVTYLRGRRQRLAAWTNDLARHALADGYDILGFFGDDHRPRTHGWDNLVRRAYWRNGSGLVYCADGLQDERLPTAPFWSADVIRALGWFYPPVLMHLYADDYWNLLADGLGRRTYLPHVLIEHMHPSATNADGSKKAVADALNRENDAFYERDAAAFAEFVRDEHPATLARVRAGLEL